MALVRRTDLYQTYVDDATGQLWLVTVATDGTVTGIVPLTGRLDAMTEAATAIEYEHHEIHDGRAFLCSDVQNVSTSTIKWMITTPNTTRHSHMLFDVHCTGEISIVITEGADRTGTNLLTCINRNRVGTPNVAGTTVHRAVSGGNTDGATTIESIRVGATGQASKVIEGGATHAANEFLLKPNTKYVIAAETFGDEYVSLHLDWYEHISQA